MDTTVKYIKMGKKLEVIRLPETMISRKINCFQHLSESKKVEISFHKIWKI